MLNVKLTKQAQKEAEVFLDDFVEQMMVIAKTAITEVYVSPLNYIDSDAWTNFREDMVRGFADYPNAKIHAEFDFKKIRAQIFKEHKEEIIKDLNKDLLDKIDHLNQQIKILEKLLAKR